MIDFLMKARRYLGECPPVEPAPRWAQWLAYPLGLALIGLALYGGAALMQ